MPRRCLIIVLLCCFSLPVSARMYQWIDAVSGITQLSGKPPVWYRSNQGGPRVLVFDDGQVIDDTGISVSDSERERLRLQALLQAEQDRQSAQEQLRDAQRLKALVDQERLDRQDEESEPAEIVEFEPETATPDEGGGDPDAEAQEVDSEAMRALVEQWEQLRSQDARNVLNGRGSAVPPPPGSPGVPGGPEPD